MFILNVLQLSALIFITQLLELKIETSCHLNKQLYFQLTSSHSTITIIVQSIPVTFSHHRTFSQNTKIQEMRQIRQKLSSQKSVSIAQKTGSLFARTYQNFERIKVSPANKNINTNLNSSQDSLKCGIDNKYLNPIYYLSTCQFARKRNFLYRNYCTIIQQYYIQFNSLYQKYTHKLKPQQQKNQKESYVKQFKSFIHEFFHTFQQVSTIHISYFQQLSYDFNRKDQILNWNTNQIIDKLKTYQKSQFQFTQTFKSHASKLNDIYVQYQMLKKDIKDPYTFFNRKTITKKTNQLFQNLKKQQEIRESLRKDLDKVCDHSVQYENNLIMYRQLLFANKYKVMKKLRQISKNSRNSLAELLVYLFDCVSRKSSQNASYLKANNGKVRRPAKSFSNNEDKLAIESYLIQVTTQYNGMIKQIQSVLKNVTQFLEQLRKFTSKQAQSNNKILQLLNIVYDIDQNSDNQLFNTLKIYLDFCLKICELNNGINLATNQFFKLKNQTKKLSQITLSLVRNSKSLHDKSFDKEHNDGSHHSQIQILLQKMSYDYPMNFIHKVQKQFQRILTYLKNDVSQKLHVKKRALQDSMQVSYYEEQTLIKPKKRVCKKQVWLWQKWQNQNEYKIDQFKIFSLGLVTQFANKLIIQLPQANQLDRYSCSLQTKGQTNGFLIIYDKYIKFQTSQGNCILSVLLSQIDDTRVVVKMLGKIVAITTQNGTVCFRGCVDVHAVVQAIQQAKNNSGAPVSKPQRKTVQVTVEQLAFMQQRKNNIKSQMPILQDFAFCNQVVIQNISIDHLFELIYSDKEVEIRGKTQPNFFAYSMKKNGSVNYQATKYDLIGPKFYTHEQESTFTNCPVFSTRIINYDVKLPPIPFMPKYAQNREQCKLFWVNNEQFTYLIHNNASGAPKADTFYIQILHKILKQEQKQTKVSMYWRIVFTQDSYLKSTIQSSAQEQSKKGINSCIADIKKYCQLISSTQNGDGKGSEQMQKMQEDNQQQERRKSEQKGFLAQLIQKIISLVRDLTGNSAKSTQETNTIAQGETLSNKPAPNNSNMKVILIILTVVLVLNLIAYLFGGKDRH